MSCIRSLAAILMLVSVLGFCSACSSMEVVPPENITVTASPNESSPARVVIPEVPETQVTKEIQFKYYEVYGLMPKDEYATKIVAITWMGCDLAADVPQAKFKKYLTVKLQPDGCTELQRLDLGKGWGVSLYGKDSDFGNLPQVDEATTVFWTYCAGQDNFYPPMIESRKTGLKTLLPPLFHAD